MITWLVSVLLIVSSSIARPRSARCPDGWFAAGVPPHGSSWCQLDTGEPGLCVRAGTKCPEEDIPRLPIRVWCRGGEMALLTDNDRNIGCRARSRVST